MYPALAYEELRTAFGDPATADWLHDAAGKSKDKHITSTQVLALNATAVEVVPAPGANKYLIFLGATVFLDYAGTAYADDAGEDLVFTYTDKNGAKVSHSLDGSLFDAEADVIAFAYPLNAAASVLEAAEDKPLCLWLEGGEWITGNSPLKVRTYYREVDKRRLESI